MRDANFNSDLSGSEQDSLFAPSAQNETWCAVRTKSRCERKVALVCEELDISCYMPLVRTAVWRKKRRREIERPLFSSYVFCRFNAEERYTLLTSGFVAQTIKVTNEPLFLREIKEINRAQTRGVDLKEHAQLRRGRMVRIMHGPLEGVVGRISHRKSGYRLVLNLSFISKGVAIELDMNDVELMEDKLAVA